jgi:hypothetical protein
MISGDELVCHVDVPASRTVVMNSSVMYHSSVMYLRPEP